MKDNAKSNPGFSTTVLFQIEQWIALAVGIGCLAIFLWSALEGHKAFSMRHLTHFNAIMLVTTGWLVTIAIGVLGVTLTWFAFHEDSEPTPVAKKSNVKVRLSVGSSGVAVASSRTK